MIILLALCNYDIRFMSIMKEEAPSFMSFERLLKDYGIDILIIYFFDIIQNIGEFMHINRNVQYIDGKKLRQIQ